jgi:YD repeat-containing protein
MRIFQRFSLFVMLVVAFSIPALAQTKVSDLKLQGLKGPVKSVVTIWKRISGYSEADLKDKTKYQTTHLFNKDGQLTEYVSVGLVKTHFVYSEIDGYKTFKSIQSKPAGAYPDIVAGTVLPSKEPLEPGEKLTAPDERFDYRYVYDTSDNGRVITERQYGKTGKLFGIRVLTYDEANRLTHETEEDPGNNMTFSYKYDEKGNVIEVLKTRDIKFQGRNSSERITYTEMKFDSTGNWTERKVTRYVETEGRPQYKIPAEKNTFVNFETRTINYY